MPTLPPCAPGEFRLLFFDSSSTCVGWSLHETTGEQTGLTLVDAGKLILKGDGHGEKMAGFRHWLFTTFDALRPDFVSFEEPFAGRFGGAYGTLMLYAAMIVEAHWTYFGEELPKEQRVPAHRIKKVLNMGRGSHETHKKNAVLLANATYGLQLKFHAGKDKNKTDDDVADAIMGGRVWFMEHRPDICPPPRPIEGIGARKRKARKADSRKRTAEGTRARARKARAGS